MFKLKKGYDEYANKTFRLPDIIVSELESLSAEYNLSVNKIVIQCIEYALKNMKPQEDILNEDKETPSKKQQK